MICWLYFDHYFKEAHIVIQTTLTAANATKKHIMAGIAPKFKVKQVFYSSIGFRKDGTSGVPDQKCIICGFTLQNHVIINVLEEKGQMHTIHKAHLDD